MGDVPPDVVDLISDHFDRIDDTTKAARFICRAVESLDERELQELEDTAATARHYGIGATRQAEAERAHERIKALLALREQLDEIDDEPT